MILSNKKSKAVFEKTVLPRRSAQAALKSELLGHL
jgi:hypothetical protein